MRGLDTNLLIRYLTGDEPAQAAVAGRILEDAEKRQEPLYINPIVFAV